VTIYIVSVFAIAPGRSGRLRQLRDETGDRQRAETSHRHSIDAGRHDEIFGSTRSPTL
jgi:hypothetical protein